MATCEYEIDQKYLNGVLGGISDELGEIIEEGLKAAAGVTYPRVKANLNAVIKGTGSGQLQGALGISPVKQNGDDGYDIKIGFDEPRRDGKSNAMVANILEYGRKSKKQPPRPFMRPAKDATEHQAIEEMERVVNQKIQEKWGE